MTLMKISFHCGLLSFFFIFVLLSFAIAQPAAKQYLMFIGTYTDKGSEGIYSFRYDASTAKLTPFGVAAETTNPSFLAIDPSHRYLYAVNEVQKYKDAAAGAVTAFSIDSKTGKLQALNQTPSHGADPCYVSFDKTGKFALVANYTGGSVAVFPVQPDGHIGEASAFIQHTGSSVNKERQEGPHAHWIETTPDNRFAIAVDLGLDKLLVYRFDQKNGALTPNDPPFAQLDPGAGPRHLSFAPNGKFAYVVNELQSTITAFSYNASAGKFQKLAGISTLPAGFSGHNDTAEIHVHPNGKFLYASNRGHDSIVAFSVDQKTGALTLAGDFSTKGKTPRNFEIDPIGKRLFVANQDSNNIVLFNIDPNNGSLTPTDQTLQVPSPVSIQFIPVE
jgi:6-phosphogluconolactonase